MVVLPEKIMNVDKNLLLVVFGICVLSKLEQREKIRQPKKIALQAKIVN